MKYQIENENLLVEIKHCGAELCRIYGKQTQQEYMWNGDAQVWGGTSPLLFPIIGLMKDNKYIYKGKSYDMPKHGFVRGSNDFTLVNKTTDSVTLAYKYSEETLQIYPFKFELQITFSLEGHKLEINHKVCNLGEEEMLFSIGGHPAFKCPLNEGERYEDYYIEFDTTETAEACQINKDGLLLESTLPIINNTNKLELHPEIFANDALMFKYMKSTSASLKNTVNNTVIKVTYPGFDYLGLWAKPHANFVCIEPWMGINDALNSNGQLNDKEGICTVDALSELSASYSVEICETIA